MKIFSILQQDHDIIHQCLEEISNWQFTGIKKIDVKQKCMKKIVAWLYYLKEQELNPDGYYRKYLEDNIIELRIQLPQSQYLLRIICWFDQKEIILLTWYIIKPQEYTDQQTQNAIDEQYREQIRISKYYRKDFKEHKKLDYSDITDYLFF